ncbi:MAG: penicillin acylase family protein [Deltaproteobacteria bacterium]|nr:penicillin acylase family protein [Deltaproteobacteria bacterium]
MERPKNGLWSSVLSAFLAPIIRSLDKPSLPKYQGDLILPRLYHRVEVYWEAHGVPHVLAADEHDLFLAQGYLHAQERLWQMDMSRRFLTGRIAEIFGDFSIPWRELASRFRGRGSVDFDYFMRLIGIRQSALASLELLAEDDRMRLQAYSDGVNRYIEQCRQKLPWEFRLLRYQPEPWKPEDSLTVGKGLAFLVSPALFSRLNMISIAARLDHQPEKLHSLFPSYPEDGPTITRAVKDAAQGIWRFVNGALMASDRHPAGQGSNSWVIAPQRSATGSAVLCNDPHLRMTLPAIWYLMHLRAQSSFTPAEGYEAWGASIPGCPCIYIGHNRWIAWGVTAAVCDDVDLYREKIHRLEPDRYLSGHEWRPMARRDEVIRIRGGGTVKRTVRLTRHGPVISDFDGDVRASEVLSVRWTAHEPGQDFRSLYGVNQAQDWNQFLESLAFHTAPALNFVYADRRGNIGYSLAGRIPNRPRGPSLLPLSGWEESDDWQGFIPFDELPRISNPPDGVIATANNKIVDASYPYYLSCFFEPPHRVRRIQELLAAKQTHSLHDLAKIQLDSVSLHAQETIEALKTELSSVRREDSRVGAAVDRLSIWDGDCGENSIEAAIFHVFHHRLMANLLIPELGEELFPAYLEIFNQCIVPVEQILRNPQSPWFASRSRSDLVARSLREAVDELSTALGDEMERWQWGRIHTLSLNHPLGRFSPLRPTVSVGPFPSSGDGTTVNLGFYRHSAPYHHTVGPSLRVIVDLGDWERSGFILSSGQSGHPYSRHYADQTPLWRNHDYIRIFAVDEEMPNRPRLSLTPGK